MKGCASRGLTGSVPPDPYGQQTGKESQESTPKAVTSLQADETETDRPFAEFFMSSAFFMLFLTFNLISIFTGKIPIKAGVL